MGVYLFGWTSGGEPQLEGTFRPWLRLAFSYYGMAALGLTIMFHAIKETNETYPTIRMTVFVFHFIALGMALATAFDRAGCYLNPVFGCLG